MSVRRHFFNGASVSLKHLGLAIVGACAVSFYPAHNAWLEAGAQSRDDAAIARQFVGMWRLVSYQQRLADGTLRQSPLSVGYIIYTDVGRMCYVSMDPNRPMWNMGGKRDPLGYAPTPEEASSGIAGLGAYCAAVEVHAKEGFVLHRVEVDKTPNMIGATRKRWFTFEGPDRVVLSVDPAENNPPVIDTRLTWERVTK